MKKILKWLTIFLIWVLPSLLFSFDTSFYQELNLPFFAPPKIVFPIAWTIIFIFLSFNIYKILKEYSFKDIKDYTKPLLFNYVANQLFTFFLFGLKSPFLAFVDSVFVLLSLLFVYYESKSLNKNATKLLLPYLIWSFFGTILATTIYFMNL